MRVMMRQCAAVLLLLCILALPGCGASPEESGGEDSLYYSLEAYNLPNAGFAGIEKLLRDRFELPAVLEVRQFEAAITKKGMLERFFIVLDTYDESFGWQGTSRFAYDKCGAGKIEQTPIEDTGDEPAPVFNANYAIEHLDGELRRIPLAEQLSNLDFPAYILHFVRGTKLLENAPIIDGSAGNEFPVLTVSEYLDGAGGLSDGHTAVIFTLYDGVGMAGDHRLDYRCAPADTDTLYGDRNQSPQRDFRVDTGRIYFSRDWGETWIQGDLPESDLAATMEFYGSELFIPEDSFYISPEPGGTVAFFYGRASLLRLSQNDGASWETVSLGMEDWEFRDFTRRMVGFVDGQNGYAALGTDWSPGGGEAKFAFYTSDGGKTWEMGGELPEQGKPLALTGMCFLTKEVGVLSLARKGEFDMPVIYVTKDAGETWTQTPTREEVEFDEFLYAVKVDSLTYANGVYDLVLGQGTNGNKKLRFQSNESMTGWDYQENYTAVTHSDG